MRDTSSGLYRRRLSALHEALILIITQFISLGVAQHEAYILGFHLFCLCILGHSATVRTGWSRAPGCLSPPDALAEP